MDSQRRRPVSPWLLAFLAEQSELAPGDERPEPVERLFHAGAGLRGHHGELGYREPSRDRIALAMLQTSITPSSRIRSKCRSLETRMARSWRQVAAWRRSAGSGVVTCSAQTVTKFRSTCTSRVRLSSAPTSQAAVSDRNSSAYRSISSTQNALPTSCMASRWRRARRNRRVAVSRRGCFTAATKRFVSSKKIRVRRSDAGTHFLPDLARDRVDVASRELLLEAGSEGVDVEFLKYDPAAVREGDEELRALVDPGRLANGLGDHDPPGPVDGDDVFHGRSNAIMPFNSCDTKIPRIPVDWFSSTRPVRPAGLLALFEEASELPPRDESPQALERPFHAGTRLRGRHEELRPAALRDLLDVLLAELTVRLEVRLVHRNEDGHAHDDLPHGVDPARDAVEGAPAREVGDGQDAARSREVRLPQQLPEGLVAHDVPDRHVELHLEVLLLDRDAQLLLRHLGAEGRLVAVVVLVEDVPPDEGRLPDGRVSDEAHFRLHDHGSHGFRAAG